MKQIWKKDLTSFAFLFAVTTVCTLFLSGANAVYQGVLAERQKELRMEILSKFGVVFTEENFTERFDENVDMITDRKNTYFIFQGTPRQGGITTSGTGLWGTIELLVLINEETEKIMELKVMHHTETPGLGGRIEEEWFLSQFRDLDYSGSVKIVRERTGARGEVDAISGATVTSRSVEDIINDALSRYRQKVGR